MQSSAQDAARLSFKEKGSWGLVDRPEKALGRHCCVLQQTSVAGVCAHARVRGSRAPARGPVRLAYMWGRSPASLWCRSLAPFHGGARWSFARIINHLGTSREAIREGD